MALDLTPWAVGGGASHPVEVARTQTFVATSGASGVASPGGLKVAALAVPGGKARVAPGAALLPNRYPGGAEQSYTLRNASETELAIAPTTSAAGRTDLIVARILDPQYEGSAPENPDGFPYARLEVIQGVPAGTTTFNPAYPCVVLARVTLPASTATVQAGHITDLRSLAQPRSVYLVEMSGPAPENMLTDPDGTIWPNYRPNVRIPEWATHVSLVVTLASVGHRGGNVEGILAGTIGDPGPGQFRSGNAGYDLDLPPTSGVRHTFVVGGKGKLPAGVAGTTRPLGTEGKRTAGPGHLVTVEGTQVIYQVTFSEETV